MAGAARGFFAKGSDPTGGIQVTQDHPQRGNRQGRPDEPSTGRWRRGLDAQDEHIGGVDAAANDAAVSGSSGRIV